MYHNYPMWESNPQVLQSKVTSWVTLFHLHLKYRFIFVFIRTFPTSSYTPHADTFNAFN